MATPFKVEQEYRGFTLTSCRTSTTYSGMAKGRGTVVLCGGQAGATHDSTLAELRRKLDILFARGLGVFSDAPQPNPEETAMDEQIPDLMRRLAEAQKEGRRELVKDHGAVNATGWWRTFGTLGDPCDLGPHDDAYRDACDCMGLREDERDEFFPDYCDGWHERNAAIRAQHPDTPSV